MTFRRSSPHAKARWFVLLGAVASMTVLIGTAVLASHPEVSLTPSNFEIDINANLKADDASPSIDWASVTENRQTDKVNGTGDNSYSGGVKEDTACPSETTDSIPPNKSDLLSFHVYREAGTGTHPGFLNLAWSRVSEPSGTTLMDFEFNQSSTSCASGPNKLRTAGDLLIEYAIDQGGSRADITVRYWSGTAWGPAADLDVASATCGGNPCAAGTINSSAIPFGESDGLITSGEKQARTFGEAQVDLRLIFQSDNCTSFGSAMLKSRSSDAFNSQLKDFVSPVGINIANCGRIVVNKVDQDSVLLDGASFSVAPGQTTNGNTASSSAMTDLGGGVFCLDNLLLGVEYTITETVVPANYEGEDPKKFTVTSAGSCTGVSSTTTPDVTFTNTRLFGSILVVKEDENAALLGGAGFTITPGDIAMTESADGVFCADGLDFDDYTVTETTVPPGYTGADPANVTVSAESTCDERLDEDGLPSGDVDATFTNNPVPGTVNILKVDDDDPANPLEGVGFTIYVDDNEDGIWDDVDEDTVAKDEQFTDEAGETTFTDVPLGFYCAVETTTSADHSPADPQCFEIGLGATAGEGQTINLTFVNPRLHKVIVIVCHQGTDSLAASDVTDGDAANDLTTVAEGSTLPDGVSEADLCSLEGFEDLEHGDLDLTVDVGSDAHPAP